MTCLGRSWGRATLQFADDVVYRHLDQAQVLQAIQGLGAERAEALVLRVVLALSVEETALLWARAKPRLRCSCIAPWASCASAWWRSQKENAQ